MRRRAVSSRARPFGINSLTGSAIGDVSGAFTVHGLTAVERHTSGGSVVINLAGDPYSVPRTATGDVVMMQGAAINFSGGGIIYGAGAQDTTMLVSGTKIYDISTANANITYDRILNTQTFASSKFGTTREYDGVYYGGAFPVNKYSALVHRGRQRRAASHCRPGQASSTAPSSAMAHKRASSRTQDLGPHKRDGQPVAVWLYRGQRRHIEDRRYGGDQQRRKRGHGQFPHTIDRREPTDAPLPRQAFSRTDPLPSATTVLSAATLTNAGLSTPPLRPTRLSPWRRGRR